MKNILLKKKKKNCSLTRIDLKQTVHQLDAYTTKACCCSKMLDTHLKPVVYLNGFDSLHQGIVHLRPVSVVKPQSEQPAK